MIHNWIQLSTLLEAQKWEKHYLDLDKTVRAQIKAMRLYGTVLNNYMMGLTLPKEDLQSMVQTLEENLKYDSVWYLYYYYQIKSLIYEGKELENMILEAVSVFEKRYIKHSNFVVIFKMELINYYQDNKDYNRAINVVKETIPITNEDTIPYLNIKYMQTELYTEMGDYQSAINIYKKVIESPIYKSIANEQKMKWDILYRRIIEDSKS